MVPLAGALIVDLTHLWAGPLCTQILADLGASVVKVEGPRRQDPMRSLARPPHGQPSFAALHAGKRAMTLDLNRESGRDAFVEVLALADGVVDNFSRRAFNNWGLDRERLADEHNLLWLSMPAFAQDTPFASYTCHGPGLEGVSGHAATCSASGVPRLLDAPLTDPLAGLRAVFEFLAARYAGVTGHIEVAQDRVAAGIAEAVVLNGATELPRIPPIASAGRLLPMEPAPFEGGVVAWR